MKIGKAGSRFANILKNATASKSASTLFLVVLLSLVVTGPVVTADDFGAADTDAPSADLPPPDAPPSSDEEPIPALEPDATAPTAETPAAETPPAEQPSAETPSSSSAAAAAAATTAGTNELPDIEARSYRVKPIKKSTSGRIYLMDAPDASSLPPEGKLLLLKQSDRNVMAMRVLRSLSDTRQLIVKRVRHYGEPLLKLYDEFVAFEKVSDVEPPKPTAQDRKEMEEVLPPPPSPIDEQREPAKKEQDPILGEDLIEEDRLGYGVEDVDPSLSPPNWITAGFGLLRNTPNPESALQTQLYGGGGIRYGHNIKERWTLEGGLFMYQVLSLSEEGGDSYTIVPISGTLRYNIPMSETFSFFLYGGFIKNFVMSSSPPVGTDSTDSSFTDRVSALSSLLPAAGGGLFYQMGPGWYARLDLGLDLVGVGICLRF